MEHRALPERAFQGPIIMLLFSALMLQLEPSQGMAILGNPCTPINIANDFMHHPHPYDRTKYIQCSEYGHPYVMSCAPGQQWSSIHQTCAGTGSVAVNAIPAPMPHVPVPASVPVLARMPAQAPVPAPAPAPSGHNGMKVMMTLGTNNYQNNHYQGSNQQNSGYVYNYQYSNHQQNTKSTNHGHHSSSVHVPASMDTSENAAYLYVAASLGGLPDQLHCQSRHARYMAMPDNVHMYYECVEGQPQQMACPGDQVWVNPLRQCVDLMQVSQSNNNNDVNNQGMSHNPCIGSDSRYHPYPNDPRKYMECTNWQRVTVWECGPQQMWSQQTQSCIDHSVMTPVHIIVQTAPPAPPPPAPQPAPAPAPVPRQVISPPGPRVRISRPGNPCLFSKSLYHPVPGNATKYIQCDEFGNAYLRICGSFKIWDDFYKTCVGRQDASDDSETRTFIDVDDGSDGDMTAVMEASGTVAEGSFMAEDLIPRQLSRTSSSDANLRNCPPGSVFDIITRLCVQFSSINDRIDNCADGLHWDDVASRCVPIGALVETSGNSMLRNFEAALRNDMGTPFNDLESNFVAPNTGNSLVLSSEGNTIVYTGANPCGTEKDKYYYEFPEDPHFYIQCDQMANVYIQPCDLGEIWSQDIVTCVPDLADPVYNPATGMPTMPEINSSNDDSASSDANPCLTSDLTYHKHVDKHQFIMCVQNIPYPMHCPFGSYWWEDVKTCFWPPQDPVSALTQ